MSRSLQTQLNHRAARVVAGLSLLLVSAWAPVGAQSIDPASINRVDAPPCTPSISAPGQAASLLCESNGNAVNRSGGSSLNAAGVMRGQALAQVAFEAMGKNAATVAVWRDGLEWLGGATPSQLALDFALNGSFALAIGRLDNTLSPLGTEQGRLAAALQLSAGGAGSGAVPVQRELAAGLQRDSRSLVGTLVQPVALSGGMTIPLGAWTSGVILPVELRLTTEAAAVNDWFRSGAGSVVGQADFLAGSGLTGLRWLDATGQDISDQVEWRWQVGVSPVPEPTTALLFVLGGVLLWAARSRPRACAWTLPVMLAGWLGSAAAAPGAAAPAPVVVNGHTLDAAKRQAIEGRTGVPLQPGRWWYDARSGLWGAEGHGAAGFAPAGLDVGAPLPPQVSGGRAGVFFNGRNLSDAEIAWLRTLGPVWPGRYWLDAMGNVGLEGQTLPFANLAMLAQARHGGARSHATRNGTWIASDGQCVVVSGKSSSGIGSFGASNC